MADLNGETSDLPQDGSDRHAELVNLIAQATSIYSVKDYDAAAELYSQATELQAELNGEMAPENADLLYAYGRCLYHVAVRSSDVLGSKVAGEEQRAVSDPPRKSKGKKDSVAIDDSASVDKTKAAEEPITQAAEDVDGTTRSEDGQYAGAKPYFQFNGDENFDDSDEDADAPQPEGEAGEEAEEEDDFANAFEVLDLARVLLMKRLQEKEEEKQEQPDKRQNEGSRSAKVKQLKERLADTHDLQAEISLESERFPNAVLDLRATLDLKKGLFPEESSLIAEAHYKLSLALEFSSVTEQKSEDGAKDTKTEAHVDEAMREEAAKEMEAAIASCRLRISKEEENLRREENTNRVASEGSQKRSTTEQDINDVKDMVADMEQRVSPRNQEFSLHKTP